jgi:hypothetical protein
MSDAAHQHGVNVELKAEREHDRTVAPPLAREQETPACYIAGEEGAAGASR